MNAFLAILNKELKSFFYSPMAYFIIAFFTAITAAFFYLNLNSFVEMSLMDQIYQQQYRMGPRTLNVNLMMIRPYFYNIVLISLFFLPLLTMRLYSEEKRSGTIELLYTTPITPIQIVLAKFFAGLAFYLVALIPTLFFIAILFSYGEPEFWPVFSGYIGLILMGSAYISLGLLISTSTEHQIIAAIGGFGLSLLLWVIGFGAGYAGQTLGEIMNYLSIINHFEDFAQGVIDTTHVVYYLLFTMTGIYFSLKMVESVKWRA